MARDGGLRSLYSKNLPNFHWTSIETPFTVLGVPDSNYCFEGAEGWIENKLIRSGEKVGMRPEQCAWLERRARAGGRVHIGVRWPAREDSYWLLKPAAARLLLGAGLGSLPADLIAGCWYGGPKRWKWPIIGTILTRV